MFQKNKSIYSLEKNIKDIDQAGNIKPDKEKSTEKIDAVVALIMSLDRAIRNEERRESVYNNRGLVVF